MWTAEQLVKRRLAIDASPVLRRLRDRLEDLIAPVVDRPIYVPDQKALLSRDGGVCAVDGARLAFDPLEPFVHRCPRCRTAYQRDRDHRAWIWRYPIWLSERAVHLAVLAALGGGEVLAGKAIEILDKYADRYRTYPNRDNVLGPTRLFFSTYLESIWLTQIVIAAALLEAIGRSVGPKVASTVEESATLIASFDEGWSNRQVWNSLALCAAGAWLDRSDLLTAGAEGAHGIRAQLSTAVSDDALWFEGENYHFFALRGLQLAAEILRASGTDLYGGRDGMLLRMFTAPLNTLLPDLTLPARGDAPFGVSVRQARFAELWEVGRARGADARVEAVLAAIYAPDLDEERDHGLAELAEQEINRPPRRITRWGLSWKALLWMVPQPPTPGRWDGGSRLLVSAGVAVLRSAADRYVGLECGGRPAGHGHPDLLHVTLYAGGPCLVDPGTGSYVDANLAWYRSTLAHNAPGPTEADQQGRRGGVDAFAADDPWAWVQATADGVLGPGTAVTRSLVCGPAWVLDVVDVVAPESCSVDLPIHTVDGAVDGSSLARFPLSQETSVTAILAPRVRENLEVLSGAAPPDLWLAPGAPRAFVVRRACGSGRWVQVYELEVGTVTAVSDDGEEIRVTQQGGGVVTAQVGNGRAEIREPEGKRVRLSGARRRPSSPVARTSVARRRVACPTVTRDVDPASWERQIPADTMFALGAGEYRRSEYPYDGSFRAIGALFAHGTRIGFAVRVFKRATCFRAADAVDPQLDNEMADIHSDGLQCYVMLYDWTGWLAIPEPGTRDVRVVPTGGGGRSSPAVRGRWSPTEDGYAVVFEVETGSPLRRGDRIAVNVVVNEMYADRERRAGQLALADGGGWTYLRGDRESPLTAALAEVV
jgi:hypothetical protein